MISRMTTDAPKDRGTMPARTKGGWLRIFGLLLVVGAVAAHGIWLIVESYLLDSRIAAIRAAGEPILPEDFAVAKIDAPDNAVTQLLEVGRMLMHDDDAWRKFAELEPAFPLRPEE